MSPQEVVTRMGDAKEFGSVAWISTPDATGVRENGPGRISGISHGRGGATAFDAEMQKDGWVVISDVAWRGWRATIDGRRAEVHHANAAFLSVFVPRGHHRVRLTYLPSSFVIGAAISFAALCVMAVWGTTRGLRRAGTTGGASLAQPERTPVARSTLPAQTACAGPPSSSCSSPSSST
jgi:hypothetical protein